MICWSSVENIRLMEDFAAAFERDRVRVRSTIRKGAIQKLVSESALSVLDSAHPPCPRAASGAYLLHIGANAGQSLQDERRPFAKPRRRKDENANAAKELLVVLQEVLVDQPWPTRRDNLRKCLAQLMKNHSPKDKSKAIPTWFREWADSCYKQGKSLPYHDAINCVLQEWSKDGCIQMIPSEISEWTWTLNRVHAVDHNVGLRPQQEPDDDDDIDVEVIMEVYDRKIDSKPTNSASQSGEGTCPMEALVDFLLLLRSNFRENTIQYPDCEHKLNTYFKKTIKPNTVNQLPRGLCAWVQQVKQKYAAANRYNIDVVHQKAMAEIQTRLIHQLMSCHVITKTRNNKSAWKWHCGEIKVRTRHCSPHQQKETIAVNRKRASTTTENETPTRAQKKQRRQGTFGTTAANSNSVVPFQQQQIIFCSTTRSSKKSICSSLVKKYRVQIVEKPDQLTNAARQLLSASTQNAEANTNNVRCNQEVFAIGCKEDSNGRMQLLQVCTKDTAYIFDCVKLNPSDIFNVLYQIFTNGRTINLVHNLNPLALAFASAAVLLDPSLVGTLDTQLAMEVLTGEANMDLHDMLEHFGLPIDPYCNHASHRGIDITSHQHPTTPTLVEIATYEVMQLMETKNLVLYALKADEEKFELARAASTARAAMALATGASNQFSFDLSTSYSIASLDLLQIERPKDLLATQPPIVSDDVKTLIDLLPSDLSRDLPDSRFFLDDLSDIVLDNGRQPSAWSGGKRKALGDGDCVVTTAHMSSIINKLGGFGEDNRACLEEQLHRISAVRNRQNNIIGLTMRVGRHVLGAAVMISDLLFADPTKSILFLGGPGSGKTTIVRDATRLLAERYNTVIVDTSNEIAGDGDIPHPCVGQARRMMVPSIREQGKVMVECVQNHTPDVMVIDEIGRPAEVSAARTCKQRGVRLVASAHGDLRMLVKNNELQGLVGGITTVIIGDGEAREEMQRRQEGGGSLQKLRTERTGEPVFDIIVELRKGVYHEWHVVLDTGKAVDRIIEGRQYRRQRRVRNPMTGTFHLAKEEA